MGKSSVNLLRVTSFREHTLGDVYKRPNTGRKCRYIRYNDGDGNIPGLRGQIAYRVVANTANRTTPNELTCDLTDGTVAVSEEFGGVILANVITTGQYGWAHEEGLGIVPMWGSAAIDRSAIVLNNDGPFLCPHAAEDGIVAVLAATTEESIIAELLADVIAVPTAATDRFLITIPAGATGNYAVGETVTGDESTDTAVVVEVLSQGTTGYGLIVSTVVDVGGSGYFQNYTNPENIVGGTSGATGVSSQIGYQIPAGNYRLLGTR